MIENLNLKKHDHDISRDQIESIDMNFRVIENDVEIESIVIDNIECLYDALNDVIETLRVQRYIDMKYENKLMTITTNENDNEFVINENLFHRMYVEYIEREIVTIEQIDEFERINNL